MTRRTLQSLALSSLLLSGAAVADDEKSEGKSDSPSASTFHQSGALLDKSPQKRPMILSFFAGLPYGYYYYGFPFGVGARFGIPIVHDGFLPMLNDSFGIEFGADLYGVAGARFYPTLGLPVELYWAFHFTKNFAAYAKVGAVLEFNFVPYACTAIGCRAYSLVTASPIGNVGLIWHFSQKLSLRAEAGYPWIKVGLGIDL